MFTGHRVTADQVSKDINNLSNGLLLERNLHTTFGNLEWGIEATLDEDGQTWRYYMETFEQFSFNHGHRSDGIKLISSDSANGIELIFNRQTLHPLPDPNLCELHLAVCRVAHACGAAEVLDMLFYHDPEVIGPVSGSYTLPTAPDFDDFVLHYFDRRLHEESLLVGPVA